jgi:acetyl-CoA synthetase
MIISCTDLAPGKSDRLLETALRGRVAFRFISRNDLRRDVSFVELARQTNRFANVLQRLGVGKGERLFILAGRVPELYTALIGALKNGSVVSPLFSAFGPEPIRTRMAIGEGKVLLTSESLFRRKVAGILGQLPALEHILLIGDDGGRTDVPGALDLATLMEQATDDCASLQPRARTWPCCISPAAPLAHPRPRYMPRGGNCPRCD